jgi:hypothetical protein
MSRVLSQNRSGFISLMAMVVAIIMFIIGIALLTLGFNRRLFSIRANQQLAARCAADYALNKAVYQMNLRLPGPINDATLPAEDAVQVPGSSAGTYATSTYSYTVTKSSGIYSVEAHGTSGSVTKTVACDLRLKSALEYAILTKDKLDIFPCSTVNCINCGSIPLKIGTTNNPNTNAEITLKPGALVDGDILLGQNGIPSLNISGSATVTGSVYAVATDYDLPLPTVPTYLSSATSQGNKSNPATLTSGKYGNITLGNSKILTITGNVQLYVTGDISLGNSAKIIIDPNSKLTIYLGGQFDGKNGAGVTNNTHDSTLFTLYGLGSNSIHIFNSDEFYGVVYAPNASVEINNNVKIQGSVIAKDYKQDNSAIFTYDARLRTITDANLTRFVPSHWREI